MPAPRKREDELARPRARKGGEAATAPVIHGERRPVTIPRAKTHWHADALRWFNSLKTSGQADFFQDSDWAYAVIIADELTAYRGAAKRSPEMLKAILSGIEKLGTTETDRLKVRIELTAPAPQEDSAALVAIDGYRQRLGVAQ